MSTKVFKSELSELQLKYKKSEFSKNKIATSSDTFQVVRPLFNQDTIGYTEETVVLYLNNANNTLGYLKHSTGGTGQTIVDIKTILSVALISGAVCLALAHNHPSGQMFPSKDDINITNKLKSACDIVGLRLLDHVIVSGEDDFSYYSFCDEGTL